MLCHECPFSLDCLSGALVAQRRAWVCGVCRCVIIRTPIYILGVPRTQSSTLVCEPLLNGDVEFVDFNRGMCPRCLPHHYYFAFGNKREFQHYVGPRLCLTHKQWQYRRRGRHRP